MNRVQLLRTSPSQPERQDRSAGQGLSNRESCPGYHYPGSGRKRSSGEVRCGGGCEGMGVAAKGREGLVAMAGLGRGKSTGGCKDGEVIARKKGTSVGKACVSCVNGRMKPCAGRLEMWERVCGGE